MPVPKILLVFPIALLGATAACADGLDLAVRHGEDGGKIEGSGATLRLSPLWSKHWGDWRFTLHPELELNHFRYTGPLSGPRILNQGAGIGLLRFHRGDGRFGPYAEAGLGAAAFSHDKLGGKEFSTHFQFTEHVGLGVEFPGGWFVGWRYSHYSNASIKTPNDGLDMHQLMIGIRF